MMKIPSSIHNYEKTLCVRQFLFLTILAFSTGACDLTTKPELTGEKAELLKNKQALASHTAPITISGRTLTKFHIDENNVQNLHIKNSDLIKYAHRRSHIANSTFMGVKFDIASFSDSTLTNVTFEDSTFNEVGFIDTTMVNVTFKNCTFNDNKFSGLKGQAKFINSTLNAPDFYESQAILDFENSTITNKTNPHVNVFDVQKLPAAIYLKESHILGESTSGPIIVGGTLAAFKATGGSLMNVGMGDNIKDVVFSHMKLAMSMRGNYDSITIDHSQFVRFGIGDTINHLSVSDCVPSHRFALGSGTKVQTLSLSQCELQEFAPHRSLITSMDIRNTSLGLFDLQSTKLKDITLNAVRLTQADLTNAQAEHVTVDNIVLNPGGSVKDTGSNIKLH